MQEQVIEATWQEVQIAHHLAWLATQGYTSVAAHEEAGGDVLVYYIDSEGTHI